MLNPRNLSPFAHREHENKTLYTYAQFPLQEKFIYYKIGKNARSKKYRFA